MRQPIYIKIRRGDFCKQVKTSILELLIIFMVVSVLVVPFLKGLVYGLLGIAVN